MKVEKGDFIELEFTGVLKDSGEVFDTNVEGEAKKIGIETKDLKPFILRVGYQMLPKGFDKDLIGKEIGKEYSVELEAKDAFGKRDPSLVKMIPTKHFLEQNINPQRGMQLSLDGRVVKVLSSSGGRTLIDFNNPLAGRSVIYRYKILRKVSNQNEKIEAVQDFLFRRKFDYEIEGDKVFLKVDKTTEPIIKVFKEKFEELTGFNLEMRIIKEEKINNH